MEVFTLPMRHWNPEGRDWRLLQSSLFLPYLWGIETYKIHNYIEEGLQFLPYLWGIETRLFLLPCADSRKSFYPTYEALKHFSPSFTLSIKFISFYPTYEALKQSKILLSYNLSIIVFTLPMRHWNWQAKQTDRYLT